MERRRRWRARSNGTMRTEESAYSILLMELVSIRTTMSQGPGYCLLYPFDSSIPLLSVFSVNLSVFTFT